MNEKLVSKLTTFFSWITILSLLGGLIALYIKAMQNSPNSYYDPSWVVLIPY